MKVTRETTVVDHIHDLVDSGQWGLLCQVVRCLKNGQSPHVQGIDYIYPAGNLIQGIARIENRDYRSVAEEFIPDWLNRLEALLREIGEKEGFKS